MNVTESFVVDQPRAKLWALIQDIERVARCLPGVENVEVIDSDHLGIIITQKLGPFSATFDTNLTITERVEGEQIEFTAVGQTIRGASGNLRASNVVRLEDEDTSTRVVILADLALGGMLGAVGQKVVAKQSTKITHQFAENLNSEAIKTGA